MQTGRGNAKKNSSAKRKRKASAKRRKSANTKQKREPWERKTNRGNLRARREAERAHNAAVRAKWAQTKLFVSRNHDAKVVRMEEAEGRAIAAQQAAKMKAKEQAEIAKKNAEQAAGLMAYYQGQKAGEEKKNISLTCTVDNPYGIPSVSPKQTALNWLTELYKNENLPGDTVLDRTKYILDATRNGYHVHFNNRIAPGDSGFNPTFQDAAKWPSSGNQVGHYLTAIDVSIWANNQSPIIRNFTRAVAIDLVIGHELIGDYRGSFDNPTANQIVDMGVSALQYGAGLFTNIYTNGESQEWLLSGEDENFNKILQIGPSFNILRSGNSIQDLRLTYQGWTDAERILNGDFETNEEFADALQNNLGNGNLP